MRTPLFLFLLTFKFIVNSQVIDINGKVYQTIVIGNQTWMAENLNADRFRNGDIIKHVKTDAEWEKANTNKIPAWCYIGNDPGKGNKFGKLYNWYAVNDSRGLAPLGWHIPSSEDWDSLKNFLGENAGEKMKSKYGWLPSMDNFKDGNGSNLSGFSGLAGGYRLNGGFYSLAIGYIGQWWSSTEYDSKNSYSYCLFNESDYLSKDKDFKNEGFSVRCVKDK